MVGPCSKRNAYHYLAEKYNASQTLICKTIDLYRSTLRRKSTKDDSETEAKLLELAEKYTTRGMDYYFGKIRMQGLIWNRKRVRRVYNKLNLKLRRKHRKRINRLYSEALVQPILPNITWSMDFMSDSLEDGRKVRILNVIDDYNRECLAIEVGVSISSDRVIRVLEWIIEIKGKPESIRTDNGPEFTSGNYIEWCQRMGIRPNHIMPGKPKQNGFIERFNRTFREDVLDAYIFENINQLQIKSDLWKEEYNIGHPHQAFQRMSPIGFENSRSKVIDAYEKVKAKLNGSLKSPALTISSSSIGCSLSEISKE